MRGDYHNLLQLIISPDSKYSTKIIGLKTYGNSEREDHGQNLQELSPLKKKPY